MSMFEWAILGALMFALAIFCARVMRRGLTTLDDDRQKNLERMDAVARSVDEDKKKIPADEQFHLIESAVRDLLRLDNRQEDCRMEVEGRLISLATPQGEWQVELVMRERSLRSRNKVLYGQSRWLLRGPRASEEHWDAASLMASIARQMRGEVAPAPTPAHIARRLKR